jgi:hypothetical protein
MRTLKRTRGDDWRFRFKLIFLDEFDEPLVPQPDIDITAATFRSTIRETYGGPILWTAGSPDITVIDAVTRVVQLLVPKAETVDLPPAGSQKGVAYLCDFEVTTADAFTETAETFKILARPDVTI